MQRFNNFALGIFAYFFFNSGFQHVYPVSQPIVKEGPPLPYIQPYLALYIQICLPCQPAKSGGVMGALRGNNQKVGGSSPPGGDYAIFSFGIFSLLIL